MATGRRETRGKEGISRFYCEVCGREVPPEDESCPYCGIPFVAVKCPQCGYTDKALRFLHGCPYCGYLSPQQRKELERKELGRKKSNRRNSPKKRPAQGARPGQEPYPLPGDLSGGKRQKKEGNDLFATFLLIFLLLALGTLMVLYVII